MSLELDVYRVERPGEKRERDRFAQGLVRWFTYSDGKVDVTDEQALSLSAVNWPASNIYKWIFFSWHGFSES